MIRARTLDENTLQDHYYIEPADNILYLREYTSGVGFDFGKTNSLITNIKKKPSLQGTPQWRYKIRDMHQCATDIGNVLNDDWLRTGTIVPIPPSKAHTDPEYDPRLIQILNAIDKPFDIDVRELVTQRVSMQAAHESEHRPSIDDLVDNYQVNENITAPQPRAIMIFDDVLTNGTHFKAMQKVLSNRFPEVPIYGLFIARRVFPNPFDDFDDIQL